MNLCCQCCEWQNMTDAEFKPIGIQRDKGLEKHPVIFQWARYDGSQH